MITTFTFAQQTPKDIKSVVSNIQKMIERDDDGQQKAYAQLLQQIDEQEKAGATVNAAIWHHITASYLYSELEDKEWEIKDRTQLADDVIPEFEQWDINTYKQQIKAHFTKALAAEQMLKKIPSKDYQEILENADASLPYIDYRPTLYDIIAQEYILTLDGTEALPVLQDLINFHQNDANLYAYLDAQIRYLQIVRNSNHKDNADEQFLQSLLSLAEKCDGKPGCVQLYYRIGAEYLALGERNGNAAYQNYLVLAVQWFEKAAAQEENSPFAIDAKNNIKRIKQKHVSIEQVDLQAANNPILLNINHKNCEHLYLRVVEGDAESMRIYGQERFNSLLKKQVLYQTEMTVTEENNYREKSDYAVLPGMKPGIYTILLSPMPFNSKAVGYCYCVITVSNIGASYVIKDDEIEFFVYDPVTGEPLPNAQVILSYVQNNQNALPIKTLNCDHSGRCSTQFTNGKNISVRIKYKNETLTLLKDRYFHYCKNDVNVHTTAALFSDRTIYRPGQTMFYKGILVKQPDNQLVKEAKGEVLFYDLNDKLIEKRAFVTNEFGSFSDSITLPQSVVTGMVRMQCKWNNQYVGGMNFLIEEYKRPTFEVAIERPSGTYKLNQDIHIEGSAKAYAGYGIAGAQVSYTVKRSVSEPWRWWYRTPSVETILTTGDVTCDENGIFKIDFKAEEDTANTIRRPIYTFVVNAVVTDVNGETHETSTSLHVSETQLLIRSEIPESIVATEDNNKFDVQLTNLSGEPQEGKIHYRIHQLAMPDQYLFPISQANYHFVDSATLCKTFPYLDFSNAKDKENWKSVAVMSEGDFEVGKQEHTFSIPDMAHLKDGYYKIVFVTSDADGKEVTEEYIVHLYRENSTKCTEYSPLSILSYSPDNMEVGDTLVFAVGSYLKNANVFYEIISNDSVICQKHITLNQNQKILTYKIENKDLGKVRVYACVAQNGYWREETKEYNVRYSHLDIDFDFITFRDKTSPGSQEEYQIRLHGKNGSAVAAELLCSMYDASLDQFSPKPAFDRSVFKHTKKQFYLDYVVKSKVAYGYYDQLKRENWYSRKCIEYPSLIALSVWFKFSIVEDIVVDEVMLSAEAPAKSRSNGYLAKGANKMMAYDMAMEEEKSAVAEEEITQESVETEVENGVQIRKNFNETAFFYPHLKTNKDGDVIIAFTIPEALTKWRMQGFAHNGDMMSGSFEKTVQTQKEMMLVPNAPRFFREGDKMNFSAKVVNIGERTIDGEVRITFYNALNHEKIVLVDETPKAFHIEQGGSQEVAFAITIPENVGAITYSIEAVSRTQDVMGDGEEATLPVLSNRMLVTESMPFSVTGKSNKTFEFQKLMNSFAQSRTLQQHKLTFEFTPNPVWYAVQALPYLMEYPYECSEQTFSRYYANTLAGQIVAAHPKIKQVFDEWSTNDPDAFCSNLEKNQELKQIIIEETPWLKDAGKEGEAKQAVAKLFDLKRLASEGKATCDKLSKMQNNDGGWPWFAGGQSSAYITQHIVAGFGHLDVLTDGQGAQNVKAMVNKAVGYMDQEMHRDYQKYHKDSPCESINLHYLYARSFFLNSKKLSANHQEAYKYYYDNAKKYWKKQSLYNQAITALVLYRNGDGELAKNIIDNIKSWAQYSEEMGMWWKRDGYGYYWNEAPVERQALLIEAFNTITKDQESVEKMQLWLLKQKQTQNWPTTKSTTEACYALLMGNNAVEQDDKSIKVSVGNQVVLPTADLHQQAGTGYVKTSWSGEDITPDKAVVKVEKDTKGAAWGALYWQYFENLDAITKSDDKNLVIEKSLYKVITGADGEQLTKITPENPIRVGDKVRVRVVIKSDRDMEYVHLKDMRAAAFEPTNVVSSYKYQDGLWYYESTRDASTNFFIEYLRKGTYVFEYTLFATQRGTFSNGITTCQCMYAPEFSSHSQGETVTVE